MNLPDVPGTYLLLMRLGVPKTLSIGRLGTFALAAGYYTYTGSAHGPGGLRARVGRHLRPHKKPHWHIDALTAAAPITEVWITTAPKRLECAWAHTLTVLPDSTQPVPGFGASDCTCAAHLLMVPAATITAAWEALKRPVRLRAP